MKTGRNEPCPCGSGKKYKNCHAEETPSTVSSNRLVWIVVALVAAGAISLFASFRGKSHETGSTRRTAAPVAPQSAAAPAPATETSAPPTDPPPGKVWSVEHGHWHDAQDPSQIQLSTTSVPTQAGAAGAATPPAGVPGSPQPEGPVPAGKVWSVEHGHWHDAPGDGSSDRVVPAELQPYMKPPGVPAAPAGAVWSEEHKHWHNAEEDAKRKAAQKADTSTTTPPAKPDNP